jgi:hypothetical protein
LDRGEGRDGEEDGIIRRKKPDPIKLSEIFQTLLYNSICKSLYEIKYGLTIDQVYLLYEKCIKRDMDDRRTGAVTLANALIYAGPSYDRAGANKKQQMWDKFMDSLDWDRLTKKRDKPSPDTIGAAFGAFGVPVTKPVIKKGGKE